MGRPRTIVNGVPHCIHDHPVTGDNVRVRSDGYLSCRTCDRHRMRTKRVAARAAQPQPPARNASALWTRENMAWATGLYEGEGCVSLDRSQGRVCAHMALGMTDLDVVQDFADIVGVGHLQHRPYAQVNRKPMWYWRLNTFADLQALAAAMWPWLHGRRRGQIRRCLMADVRRDPNSDGRRVYDGETP